MFKRVDVKVVHTPLEIWIVTTCVLEESSLPNAPFPLSNATCRTGSLGTPIPSPSLGKCCLDPSPSCRVVGITTRQRPNRMKMVREQDDGCDLEWHFYADILNCVPQRLSTEVSCEDRLAVICDDREEVDLSNAGTTVSAHWNRWPGSFGGFRYAAPTLRLLSWTRGRPVA